MVSSVSILADTLYFLKSFLGGGSGVTDPISSTRPAGQAFVMTSYPTRAVTYPLITIKDLNTNSGRALGLQSEAHFTTLTFEVRVWARNIKERDQLADSVYNKLKDNQIGASGTSQANDLHDFQLLSSVNVDENPGPKSKIMTIQYRFVAT